MIKIFISLLLLTNYAYSQTSPECNYVATDTHVYPIGACDKTKTISGNTSTYSSFKFVCEAGYVFKYEYNTDEYCHGESISSTNFTDQLQEFECNSPYLCDYSEHCSYTGCYNSSANSCSACSETTTIWDRHCIPILIDHCMSTPDGNLTYNECLVGVLTSDYYSGANCSDDTSLYNTMIIGGNKTANNCFDTAYHTAECYSHAIPACNYVTTIDSWQPHFYPIGACDTTKSTNTTSKTITYTAFKYMCNNNDIYKYEYNTSDYCQGTAISETLVNAQLSHYDCSLNDCKFADWCTLSLNECDSIGCDYDSNCLPFITDNCMGFDGEALIYDICVNDTLTINHYYGYDCPTSGLIWPEVYTTDDTQCGANTLDKVQCIDPAQTDANSIIYHTSDCTQAPTADTTEPTTNTQYPTSQPTTSPSMEPTAISNQPTRTPIIQPEECDVIWKILIRFRIKFIVDAVKEIYEESIQNGCKNAFIDAVRHLLNNEWNDLFCVDVSDNDLKVALYESDMDSRRLLQSEMEYEIQIEIEYNNELQTAVFDDDNYDKNSFTEKFSESVSSRFSEDVLINDGVSVSGLQVEEPKKIDDDDGHSVEGALVNAVSILSIIDVLLFIGCMIYVYSIMRKRVIEKGHDTIPFALFIKQLMWKEYVVCFIEVFAGIIHWVFIIDVMVVGKTYLGYVGLVILLLGDIVLILRYILYKKLCIEQVNDIMGNIDGDNNINIDSVENVRDNDMKDEIRFRKVDIGMMGWLLMSVEDIPIIILMLIIGENYDYGAIVVLCFIISIISIIMKIILLFIGKYGSVEGNKGYAKKTQDAIELGTENKGKDDAKTDDVDDKKTDSTALKAETDDVDDKKIDDKETDDKKTDDGGDKKTDNGGDKKTSGGGDKKTTGGKKEEYAD